MDQASRRRIDRLLAAVFALLSVGRLVSYFGSGETPEGLSAAGLLLLAFSIFCGRLVRRPEEADRSRLDVLATYAGYVGAALLLVSIGMRLLP